MKLCLILALSHLTGYSVCNIVVSFCVFYNFSKMRAFEFSVHIAFSIHFFFSPSLSFRALEISVRTLRHKVTLSHSVLVFFRGGGGGIVCIHLFLIWPYDDNNSQHLCGAISH